MTCPYCDSSRVRKASAVYEAGTRHSTRRNTGRGVGVGFGRKTNRGAAGIFGSKTVSKSSTLAAQRTDKARIVWWGPQETFGLFIILCVILYALNVFDPFTKAFFVSIAVMIGCPIVTGIYALEANKDYKYRWYCDACGGLWTETPQPEPLSALDMRLAKATHSRAGANINWSALPAGQERGSVELVGRCKCGEVLMWEDFWTPDDLIKCKACGSDLGRFGELKAEATEFAYNVARNTP